MTPETRLSLIAWICVKACIFPLWLSCQAAGWSATAWPSWQNPRDGKTHADNCYSAVVERAEFASSSVPPTNQFYRFQRENLGEGATDLKGALAGMIPVFVDVSEHASILDLVKDTDGTFPLMTTTGLLVNLEMPTNYFSYTPYRGLSGLGGLTNQAAAIGHPHGYTNEFTVLGGTNYPTGVTAWTTTDYGWQGIKDVCSELRYARVLSFQDDGWQGTNYQGVVFGSNSWANAKAGAEAAFTNTASGTVSPYSRTAGSLTTGFPDTYGANMQTADADYTVDSIPTGTVRRIVAFANSDSGFPAADVYDAYGTTMVETNWVQVGASSWSDTETTHSVAFGGNSTIISPWCAEPVSTNLFTSRGFRVSDDAVVHEAQFIYSSD